MRNRGLAVLMSWMMVWTVWISPVAAQEDRDFGQPVNLEEAGASEDPTRSEEAAAWEKETADTDEREEAKETIEAETDDFGEQEKPPEADTLAEWGGSSPENPDETSGSGQTADEGTDMEGFPVEGDLGRSPDEPPEGFLEDYGITIFSEENADLLSAENDPEGQSLIEEIEEGDMIALASISPEEGMYSEDFDPGLARAGAAAAQYRMVVGDTLTPDEVTKQMQYREIVYTDGNGKKRTAPIYCLNASKEGISTQDLKSEAVRALGNSTIRKLLYFGYGGPGDISDSYDPTCQHVRWSRWENRYVFTHMALSKAYSGEYGRSNEAEYEHVGVNRFLDKIKGMTIPARDGVVFRTKDAAGNYVSLKKQTVYFGNGKAGTAAHTWDWVDVSQPGFSKGFMVSETIRMIDTGKANNTVTITRDSDAPWQLGYWLSVDEFNERGNKDPRILGKGKSLVIKSGYVFRIIMPQTFSKKETWNFPMSLNPVTYLFVDGSVQTGKDVQDFGTYVYQGAAATASLTLVPDTVGTLELTKKDSLAGTAVSGASYGLYAAEEIRSRTTRLYAKAELAATGVTDKQGKISFQNIPPGNYTVKEITASPGYLLNTTAVRVAVAAGKNAVTVLEDPDLRGRISIRKTDKDTGEDLEGAEFTLYTWSKTQKAYTGGKVLAYDAGEKRYVSDLLRYTVENQGKFQIKETRNPAGYTGSFTKNVSLATLTPGEEKLFTYDVENSGITFPHIEIQKVDADTGKHLAGAEFTLYEWSEDLQSYPETGSLLTYDPENEKYVSGDLQTTEENQGKFFLKETKNPEGYEGNWEKELVLNGDNNIWSFLVQNEKITPLKGKIQIIKKDALTGEKLEGAEFQIYPWSTEENAYQMEEETAVSVFWLEEDALYESPDLFLTEENQGRFLVAETKNPKGYSGSWSQEVELTQEEEVLQLTAENTPVPGQITIVKKIRTADITWAHGNPTFLFAVTGEDFYGTMHTYEAAVTFVRDAFTEDDGYGVMQVTIPHVPLGEYQIYEKPVLRYYLEDVWANTGNVTVIRGEASGYGIDPMQTAYGIARLSETAQSASITFVNEKKRFDGYSHNSSVKNTIPIIFKEE